MPYLLFEGIGEAEPRRADIRWDADFRIGSDAQNDLVLDNPGVSGQHAQIRYSNGKFWLEDLESRNGTTVNGIKIRTKMLKDGYTICFGVDEHIEGEDRSGVCTYHVLPTDPAPEDEMHMDQSGETMLDIDFDVEEYEEEFFASGAAEGGEEAKPSFV